MSTFLGPLQSGRVPPAQQTRVGAFLISLHGALARRLTLGLPATFRYGWQTEWHSQLHRETEIAMLMMRATSWILDLELPALCLGWEMIWVARPVEGIADLSKGSWIDLAALATPPTAPSGPRLCCLLRLIRRTPSCWRCAGSNSRARV